MLIYYNNIYFRLNYTPVSLDQYLAHVTGLLGAVNEGSQMEFAS